MKKKSLWILTIAGILTLLLTAVPGIVAQNDGDVPCQDGGQTNEGDPGGDGDCLDKRNCCTKFNNNGDIADRFCVPEPCPVGYQSRKVSSCSLGCPR